MRRSRVLAVLAGEVYGCLVLAVLGLLVHLPALWCQASVAFSL